MRRKKTIKYYVACRDKKVLGFAFKKDDVAPLVEYLIKNRTFAWCGDHKSLPSLSSLSLEEINDGIRNGHIEEVA